MDNIYVDTNIILDVLLDREDFAEDSLEFLKKSQQDNNLYISALSYHIVMYVTKPSLAQKQGLENIMNQFNVVSLTDSIVKEAMNIDCKDYEDIIQFLSASKQCRTVVTRDPKDFKKSATNSRKKIEILSPTEWLRKTL